MKRIDDLLIWLALAASLGIWLWSLAVGPISPHFLLLVVALLLGTAIISNGERQRWKGRQQSYVTELKDVMSEYQVLSDEAMAHAACKASILSVMLDKKVCKTLASARSSSPKKAYNTERSNTGAEWPCGGSTGAGSIDKAARPKKIQKCEAHR